MGRQKVLLGIICCALMSFSANYVSSQPNPKIVIIGAGASGIAAGVKLLEYGFVDITILEAEPRVGGRVNTIPFGDNVIDMGAQWCHGEKNNVVYEMVKDRDPFGSTEDINKNLTFVRSNGDEVPRELVEQLVELIDGIVAKRDNESVPSTVSAHDFMKKELEIALSRPEYQHIDKEIAGEFLRVRENEECSLEASDDLTNVPARSDGEYEICEGNQALTWKDKGYGSFLQILMKSEEREGRENGVLKHIIKTSKKVKNISWQREDSKVLITLEEGKTILADHVIVTVSLGVLKADCDTLFEPKLPDKKLKAIREINFGAVGKVFLEFKETPWPSDFTGLALLWTEEDLANIRGTNDSWWGGIVGYFYVDYQPRLLEVWFVGPGARKMETLDIKELQLKLEEILDARAKWDIPDVVNIARTNWYSNPNFRGTYSYHSIQTLEAGVSPRDLEEPLTVPVSECAEKSEGSEVKCEKPVVQFAGESTNAKHYSTVHGAVETGWREADRLAAFYKINAI